VTGEEDPSATDAQ
jgi:hypothetical protein